MGNVTAMKAKAKTIESAKLVQKLVEHLNAVRKDRDYLVGYKNAKAYTVSLTAQVDASDIPSDVRARAERDYHHGHDGFHYDGNRKDWAKHHQLTDGKFDPTQNHWNGHGGIATLGWRVMDAVRAAVAEEVERTEQAIRDLGYEVPEDE